MFFVFLSTLLSEKPYIRYPVKPLSCSRCGKTWKTIPRLAKRLRIRQRSTLKKAPSSTLCELSSSNLVPTTEKTTIEDFFAFQLDDFQREAIKSLERQENVLVAAPTGSGKTVIAEAAIYLALKAGKRIFYTTPLKALSNQKFHDCQKIFGVSRVGLLTGDVNIQRDADVLVLTTEIYRNMLYADTTGISDSVFAVVFDEFHFMNDPERGTVWEEAIIASPKDVILVALSATMSNAVQLKDWLSSVHRKTSLHETHVRPVPLHFQFCDFKGLHDLLDYSDKGTNQSPTLSKSLFKQQYHRNRSNRRRKHSTLRWLQSPPTSFLVGILFRRKMLPCIIFVFSRAGCDRAAEELGNKLGSRLVNRREQQVLQNRIVQFIESFPEVASKQEDRLKLLMSGISVHHAGLLPVWKNFVEELFIDGFIKVIFATETLAAGMNMPARTTVITALYKRGDNGMERLSKSSFKQMAGRAGRRGKDSQGFCVVLQSSETNPKHVFELVTGNVEAITSKFLPTYGLVLNLLQDGKSPQQVKEFLSKSFGNFLFAFERRRQEEEKENEVKEYDKAINILTESNIVLEEWKRYRRLQQKLKIERRTWRYLRKQWTEMRCQLVEGSLLFSSCGVALWIYEDSDEDSSQSLLALETTDSIPEQNEFVVFEKECKEPRMEAAWLLESYSSNGNYPRYLCFTEHNYFRVVSLSQIVAVAESESTTVLQSSLVECLVEEYRRQRQLDKVNCNSVRCIGTEKTKSILANIPQESYILDNMKEEDPKLVSQRRKVSHILSQLEQSPIHHLKNRKALLSLYDKVSKWQKRKSQEDSSSLTDSSLQEQQTTSIEELNKTKSWDYVQSLLKTLNAMSFIENIRFTTTEKTWYRITPLGRLCVAIRGENEVWLSIVLGYLSGKIQSYEPQHLIGVVATVIGDPIREDAVIHWEASSVTSTLLEQLRGYYDQVMNIQNQNGIICVTRLESGWSGIAEAWAREANWSRLVSGTSLDEGDICRNLRRVLDILRQIPRLPASLGIISEEFRLCARRAMALMNHFPVCDDITYSLD